MSETPSERRATHTIRFSKSEWNTVRDQAERAGLRPTVYVRESAVGKRLRLRPTVDQRDLAASFADHDRQLAWIGNNFNQLVKLAHTGRLRHGADFVTVIDQLRADIDASRGDIRTALDALIGDVA